MIPEVVTETNRIIAGKTYTLTSILPKKNASIHTSNKYNLETSFALVIRGAKSRDSWDSTEVNFIFVAPVYDDATKLGTDGSISVTRTFDTEGPYQMEICYQETASSVKEMVSYASIIVEAVQSTDNGLMLGRTITAPAIITG